MNHPFIITISLFLLGFLMAIMHAIMTRDAFNFIDQKYKIRWFGLDAWNNKNDWSIFGIKKLFRLWPLIAFTDLFHLAHTCFAILLSFLIVVLCNANWLFVAGLFTIYSSVFSLFYDIVFNNKTK